ncbi:unnamed protein product [Effrenium voratum]|nr:unnamed protein product [Effrenium voratum]
MCELLTLVNGMRAASRAVTSALMLVIGLNYVFAIVINMFLSEVADEMNIEAKFKTLGLSMWSLALHGTFADSIAEILENMRALETVGYEWTLGWSMIFVFFLYVLLTNITVMNMLIGIVCEVVSEVKLKDEKNVAVDYLKRNLRQLLIELDEDQNQQISKKELNAARNMPRAREVLKELDVDLDNLIVLTEPLFEQDVDAGREQEVTREELLNVILDMRGDRDVRMEDLVRLRCDLRRYLSRRALAANPLAWIRQILFWGGATQSLGWIPGVAAQKATLPLGPFPVLRFHLLANRLLFSLVGAKGNRFHYWKFVNVWLKQMDVFEVPFDRCMEAAPGGWGQEGGSRDECGVT